MIVPTPIPDAVMLPGVPVPLPPVEAVAVPAGSVLVAVSLLVTAALLWVTKNGRDGDVPPPGAGLKTLTSNVPVDVNNAAGTTAERPESEMKVVTRSVVLVAPLCQRTTASGA